MTRTEIQTGENTFEVRFEEQSQPLFASAIEFAQQAANLALGVGAWNDERNNKQLMNLNQEDAKRVWREISS